MSTNLPSAASDSLTPRALGRTGLRVTGLCVGGAPLGDMGDIFADSPGPDRAARTLAAAFASPIRFLDTAAAYGDGVSEQRIGDAIRANGGVPEGYLIATKADPDPETGDFSGAACRASVERSRRRLGMDHLPLVYLHDPEYHADDVLMAPGGAVETLVALRDEGVIGAIGVGGGTIATMRRYLDLGVFTVMLTHNRFNLINRSGSELIDAAVERGIAVCNAGVTGGGMLARGPDHSTKFMYREAEPETIERARAYQRLADRHGVPLAAVAIQFSLRDPRITSTIVGMSRPERVRETIDLATRPLGADLWAEVDTLPYSMIEGL